MAPAHEPPEREPPERRPKERTDTLGDVQRALRIRGARPKLAGRRAKPGIRKWRETSVARCSGGCPLPLPRGCGGLARPLAVHCYAPLTASSACRPLAGCVCAAGCRPPHARLATHASCADDVLSSRVLECCAVCLSVWRHRFLDMWLHHLISPFAASVCILCARTCMDLCARCVASNRHGDANARVGQRSRPGVSGRVARARVSLSAVGPR